MPIRVQVLGHGIVEFPDGTSQDEMAKALSRLSGPASAEQFAPPSAQPEGSALGRFASNAGEMLNPVSAVKGLASAVAHPADTAKAIFDASAGQWNKAKQAYDEGRYSEALGHLGGMLPLIGPAAAEAGEQIGRGDVAGGLGKATGLLAPMGIPAAVRGARAATAVAPEGLRASIADSLASKAAANVADVMTPKVGANKARFAGMADRVAPEIAADPEMAAWSRQGLHQNIKGKLASSEQGLDAAADARLSARSVPTQPIIDALIEKRAKLTAQTVEASKPVAAVSERVSPILNESGQPITITQAAAKPLGRDVVPGPNAARVAQIDQAIGELKQLGPVTRYEPLRRIRAAYDGPAKAVYNPSMTQDFLTAQGGKLGAADVTGTLRETLAKLDPETAKANATYSLYRSADDVLEAVAETEKTRPKVGRRIMARLTTTLAGEQAAGPAGAVAGWLVGPAVDSIAAADWTTQIKFAQAQSALAKAIRSGDVGGAITASTRLKRLVAAAQTGRLTSPNESQTNQAPQLQGAR